MAKRGRGNHQKRIAKPESIPLTDKKANTWMINPCPGSHSKRNSMPLSVLVKDVLGVAKSAKEARMILVKRMVEVDGRVRTEEKFPVGLMDTISFPKAEKYYRIVVDWKGRLKPIEISKAQAKRKIVRVIGKHVAPGAKISLTFHDGKNLVSDNHIHPGDGLVISLPEAKMESHLKLTPGAKCLIVEGKHAGAIVTLNELIMRKGGKPSEAKVTGAEGEFITVARYLFVVDDSFEVSA